MRHKGIFGLVGLIDMVGMVLFLCTGETIGMLVCTCGLIASLAVINSDD